MDLTRKACIGYWMTDKKLQKLRFHEFEDLCRQSGMSTVQLDLDRPLEEQGPFDVVLHKIVDLSWDEKVGAVLGPKAKLLKTYLDSHPETVVIDPLASTMNLANRDRMYELLQQCDVVQRDTSRVFVPNFATLLTNDVDSNRQALREAGVTFPCVVKPLEADDPEKSHQMMILFGEHGLRDIQPPCVAQSFVAHDGILYKIFVIGEANYFVQRPSLKNLYARGQSTEYFHSHDVSKEWSSSPLIGIEHNIDSPCISPDPRLFDEVGASIRQKTNLDLIGIDIIIDKYSGRYGIIDINPFPGYEGVADLHQQLLELCVKRIGGRRKEKGQRDRRQPEKDFVEGAAVLDLGETCSTICSDPLLAT